MVRLFYLRAAYRSPLEFSEGLLEEASASLDRLRAFVRRSRAAAEADTHAIERFVAAMDDDFNTAEALAVLFETVREGNARLDRGRDAGPLAAAVAQVAGVLGIDLAGTGLGRSCRTAGRSGGCARCRGGGPPKPSSRL